MGFVDLVQLVNTINSSASAISRTLQFTTARTCSSQSTSPLLPTADVPVPLGSRTVPVSQPQFSNDSDTTAPFLRRLALY
jgi:hypothetical protein